ncbi:hypothetical protein NDU88_005170 [Pleurodeles waltl]|uniref:Uncharacterized protein n=1 Tax=Pleurodeles waltl TaxID=8319 RepID=A0AAV7WXW8_PLEWA|nr:hypothetical protein NDU88_005170 [Pleurodeles waltl]
MEPQRIGGAVQAKATAQRRQTGLGFAPAGWLVSSAKWSGHAPRWGGLQAAPRRPRTPAAQVEDIIKRVRFREGVVYSDSEDVSEHERLDYEEDSAEAGEIREEEDEWWTVGGV